MTSFQNLALSQPIMKALTSEKERKIRMVQLRTVSKREKILFPAVLPEQTDIETLADDRQHPLGRIEILPRDPDPFTGGEDAHIKRGCGRCRGEGHRIPIEARGLREEFGRGEQRLVLAPKINLIRGKEGWVETVCPLPDAARRAGPRA